MKRFGALKRTVRIGFVVTTAWALSGRTFAAAPADELSGFTDRYCSSCHNDTDKEAGLDLTTLKYAPDDPANFATWVKVHDRVQTGEMPPKEKKRPVAAELNTFVKTLGSSLVTADRAVIARDGRARQRRLNRTEYENAVRDLFQAPYLEVRGKLPEDGEASRFNKSSEALGVSFVHMKQYMNAAETAISAIMGVEFVRPETTTKRYYARETPTLTVINPSERLLGHPERMKFPALGTGPQPDVIRHKVPMTVGESDPATRELEAIGWVASNYEAFPTGWNSFQAPVTGKYRVRFSGYTLWVGPWGSRQGPKWDGMDRFAKAQSDIPRWYMANYDHVFPGRRDEPIVVYSRGLSGARLGAFDLTPEPQVYQLDEVWLLGSQSFTTDATRFFRSRPVPTRGWTNPLAQRDGVPAVAFRWVEVEGPLYDESSRAGYRLLFGDLPMKKVEGNAPGVAIQVVNTAPAGRRGGGGGGRGFSALTSTKVEVESADPNADGERLLRAFLPRAFRRPVLETETQRYIALFQQSLKAGVGFADAMRATYTAILASPDFVFVEEAKGRLDDNALATRLALFLWNSTPDDTLRQKAARGELHRPDVLRAETERMLADPKAKRFVAAFLDYWLDLRKMNDTTPSETLYNDYYLDDALVENAVDETQLFFTDLLQRDLPTRNIVDSDFTFLNERLAQHYGIPDVKGVAMRRVALPADSLRGGFMTHASVLKVTANGTTTSPVVRGKWIMERVIGFTMPPPPASVPAIEPDLRGAVTIRQQLDKHRADESCAVCHRKIDPPGFALENFDVMGGWRDRYRSQTPAELYDTMGRFGKNGAPLTFRLSQPVDAAGHLADGRAFDDVRGLKSLLLQDEAQLARNLTRQLLVYATGAAERFSDRAAVEQIVQGTKARQYGVRSLVHGLIQSDLFLNK
jgi:hypothetical protein